MRGGPLAWFANNGVAANLALIVIVAAGLMTAFTLRREIFPQIATDLITIAVPYPGASPEEVEQSIVVRIEERIQDLEGIKKLTSTAAENIGTVTVEVLSGTDSRKVMSDIKTRIDAIDTFPDDAEEPIVSEFVIREQVIAVAISGDTDEVTLKRLAEQVRDELSATPGITQVELAGVRPWEISVEVSEEDLLRYGLTFDQVASAVRRSSIDVPGGSIETEAGEILIRTEGQAYRGRDLEEIVVVTRANGSRVLLRDVAHVIDGFADSDLQARFDGEPAMLALVFRVGEQDATEIADGVKAYVEEASLRMPEGISLTTWQDYSAILRSRLDLLVRNGRAGLILVFLVLALFLKLRLAGWVALGIPVSFLGAIWLLPQFGVTINLMSLFAFLLVLGIVVDDAIVVGENIYRRFQEGEEGLEAAVNGVREVATPVIFSILTTVAAFSPLLAIGGSVGKFIRVIPVIVISVLSFSLLESLFILPSHLSHMKHSHNERSRVAKTKLGRGWASFRDLFSGGLTVFIRKYYSPALERALEWRYLTLSIGVFVLLFTFGFASAGWIGFTYMPPVEADNVVALVTMPLGAAPSQTAAAVRRIEQAALSLQKEVEEEAGSPVFRHVLASVGEQPYRTAQSQNPGSTGSVFAGQNLGEVNIELIPAEAREMSSVDIERRLREEVGEIPDVSELSFTSSLFANTAPISVQLSGSNLVQLEEAAEDLKQELARYPGVFDIADSFKEGKEEISIDITPEAESVGLTRADLGRQVRQAFFGEEAQRIQRGRDDVKVMVRYPESARKSVESLETMRIRTPQGGAVPFSVAGTASIERSYAAISRVDRRRVINVTADVDASENNANEINKSLNRTYLNGFVKRHPGVQASMEGEQKEQTETLGELTRGFLLALLLIYALLAVPFKSYVQPIIVMTAIPFGMIGAIWGHVIMGLDLTVLSYFGIVALTGVVVNDSLVMVDFINSRVREGIQIHEAIRQAGVVRFRPILLTSLTTFVGLLPLLLEKSLQAQFLIPMCVSLAFGVLFVTAIVLFIVPVAYLMLEDAGRLVSRFRRGPNEDAAEPVVTAS